MHHSLAAILLLAFVACGPGTPAGTEPHGSADTSARNIPSEAPWLRGTITAVEPDGKILVEETPSEPTGGQKARLELTPGTRLLRRSGTALRRSELAPGQTASVWITGPVRESYPVQATALVVVLEP